ncbi:hypothetical protein ABPG75_008582 [Micractinium tetrahymenae]
MSDPKSPFTGGPVGPSGVPPPSLPVPDAETASTFDAFMSPTRSLQHSEAHLMTRCSAAVEQCRRDLGDLRGACKAAASYREKCTELLGAATEAVVALEDMLYDPGIDLRRERALQQLATRVQAALDQGEVVVRVYGGKNGITAVLSKMCSPGTPQKFDAAIAELANLAKQVRLAQAQPAVPAGGRLLSGSVAMDSAPLASTMGAHSSQPPVLAPAASSSMAGPSSPSPSARSGTAQIAQLVPEHSAAITAVMTATTTEQDGAAPAGSGSQTAGVMWGDRFMPEEAMQQARVRKGGRGLAITAMAHVPPPMDRPGHLGYLWYFLSKAFGTSTMFVWDLSAKVETEVREAAKGSGITCMHFDDQQGLIWTGHSRGEIRVWAPDKQESLCPALKGLSSAVTCITTDERGFCWAGSDKGRVRSYRLAPEQVDGLQVGYELIQRGELLWTGDGMQAPPQSKIGKCWCHLEINQEGLVAHPLLGEQAHYGPVRSIAAAEGRVWTCGGSSAFARFKEWTQSGWQVSNADMRNTGLANDIVVVTQIVVVNEAQKVLGAPLGTLSSFTAAASVPLASRLPVTQTQVVEVDMPWQLLTVHDNGLVQVWGHVSGKLQALLQIGERTAPALRAVVCEPLGALITAHNDGQLRLRALPHVRGPSGLNVTLKDKDTLYKISSASLSTATIPMSKSGLANALGGKLGIVTASNSGAIKHLPVAELRRAAEDQGIPVLSELASGDWNQWPLLRLSALTTRHLVEERAMAQQYSTEYEEEVHTERDGSDAQDRATVTLSEDTEEWLIDWNDLHRSKIIGEGAFGKVWLGRWQETDVAIKQLGSLSALGVQTGSLQHDSSGGIKMDAEVQRSLHKEVDLMRKMRHPNIILFMGVVAEPAAVVTEYCARGSLYDLLKEARHKPALTKALDWPRRIVMALDAAKGMLYLHGHKPQPIIHRDLKSPNLLVTKDWRVKVTDFNLSKSQPLEAPDKAASVQSLVANNPRWQPPEVIKEQQYTKASDVYAFGLIMWELLTWELPFIELTNFQIMMAVTQQGKRPAVKDQWGAAQYPGGTFVAYEEYVALMQRCWADNPEARPTFEQVIVDLRKSAKIVADARAPARLLPAHSRSYSRSTPPHLAVPSSTPAAALPAPEAAPAPAAARTAVPSPFDAPKQQPGPAPGPPTPAVAAVGAAVAAAAAAGVVDSTPACNGQHPQSMPGSVAGSTTAQPRSEAGTEAPLSTAPSGSTGPLAAALSGASVISNAAPPPSPFDHPTGPTVVASNAAMPAGPFGGGPAPWLQQGAAAAAGPAVRSAAPPPPSPFGGSPAAAATPVQAAGGPISSAAPPPPSPFDAAPVAAAAAIPAARQPISSAAPPPPSPFGAAPAAGQPISSAAPPPPSPFGAAISSMAPPPPSPFGAAPAVGQPISSAAQPPPSPFGAAISSAAPPPPSPFGAAPAVGQPTSSAAQPPPSSFGAAPPVGQPTSSAAPPHPSPFGSAAVLPAAGAAISSAAPPPPSPFDAAPAGAAAPEAGRLSPFAAHLPREAPEPRQPWDASGMPSTVLEASPSLEAAAADASSPQLETINSGVCSPDPSSHAAVPGSEGAGPAAAPAAAPGAEAGNGVRSGGSRRGLVNSLRRSLSGSGGRKVKRMQSR